MSAAQKHKLFEKVMKQLEIMSFANRRIGGNGDNNSISQQARKKVTIAVMKIWDYLIKYYYYKQVVKWYILMIY